MHTQDVPLRLQCAAELGRPNGRLTGDQDGFDGGIGQDFLGIAHAPRFSTQAIHDLLTQRCRVREDAMTPGLGEGARQFDSIGVISQ